jgi:D-beta-D-heptose 7-phosphate kinase/D-beta-D-heptose 1-phosphate adenosyltransferase
MYRNKKIAVFGDVMLDIWREGDNYKLSPEAPVLDVANPDITYGLGGVGNVARIAAQLGADVTVFTVLGGEESSEYTTKLRELFAEAGIKLCDAADNTRKVTTKERIICHKQQVCRISSETTIDIIQPDAKGLLQFFDEQWFDGLIISDYNKGVMTEYMIRHLLNMAKDIPVLVDPKYKNFWEYGGCTIFKPNQLEYETSAGDMYANGIDDATIFRNIGADYLVTTSENGMFYTNGGDTQGYVKVHPAEVVNVSGCGDAAAAVMLLEYLDTNDIVKSVKMANYAAHLVVERKHTGYLKPEELQTFRRTGS